MLLFDSSPGFPLPLIMILMLLSGFNIQAMHLQFAGLDSAQRQEMLNEELHFRANTGNFEDVKELVEVGAQVNAQNKFGAPTLTSVLSNWCPGHAYHEEIRPKIMAFLLAQGADINLSDNRGESPLMRAVINRISSAIQLLINSGADINQKDGEGRTALMFAMIYPNLQACNMLLAAGPDLEIAANNKKTALMLAAKLKKNTLTEPILKRITQLQEHEKGSLKNWLLVNQKMKSDHRITLSRDMIMYVARMLTQALAIDLQERVIRAGGLKALERARVKCQQGKILSEPIKILEDYLDLNFLEGLVQTQTLLPKLVKSEWQSEIAQIN